MIKISSSDTIVDILKKIWKDDSDKIILNFPFWHPVLYNHLSLKIIKSKTVKKELLILTNDKTSRKIWLHLWIKYWKNNIEHKYASLNQKTLKENYTFFEYALIEIKLFFGLMHWNLKWIKKVNKIYYEKNKFSENYKSIIIFFIITLFLVISILFYIFSFTINKTTITITPEILVKLKSKNFNYVEFYKNTENTEINNENKWIRTPKFNNEIRLRKISKTINLSKTYSTTGISQDKKNLASWTIIIKNFLEEKITLLENTTFLTEDWIQFFIKKNINIPSAIYKKNKLIPWEIKVIIFWKIKMSNWKYAWEKINIKKGTLLTIPKLKNNKTKIFAKSISEIKWWNNEFIHFLEKSDIEKSKKMLKIALKKKAIEEIKKVIENENKNNSIKISILPVDNIYKFYDENIIIPEYLVENFITKNFKLTWEITIDTYVYEKSSVIVKLNNLIKERNISWLEKIEQVNLDTLRISHIITRNDLIKHNWKYSYKQNMWDKLLRIKWTTEIEYLVTRKFKEWGQYINKFKNLILGLNKKEAEKILINNNEINNILIDIKPFFMDTISKRAENIYIKVDE